MTETGLRLTPAQLGRLNHALRREAALMFGDGTVPPAWEEDSEQHHEESERSARSLLLHIPQSAEEEHERWAEAKRVLGWTWGPVRDDENKRHPSLVLFRQLPPGEQLKDILRLVLARGLAEYVDMRT